MRRFSFYAATISLLSLINTPSYAEVDDIERTQFEKQIHEYLLQNPEVIIEAIQLYQQRQEQQAQLNDQELIQRNAELIYNDKNSWAGGNLKGDITVVEFLDYRCSYCRRAHDELEELVKSDGNIRFVIKELPILGEESILAAQFALAVKNIHGDDSYKQAHDQLMQMRGPINEKSLRALASELNLNTDEVMVGMNDPLVLDTIKQNYELAQTMQIQGTPSFVVQTQMLRGYMPLDGMREVIRQERQSS